MYQITKKDLEILHKDFQENEINDGEVCFIFNPSDLEKLFGKIRESQAEKCAEIYKEITGDFDYGKKIHKFLNSWKGEKNERKNHIQDNRSMV